MAKARHFNGLLTKLNPDQCTALGQAHVFYVVPLVMGQMLQCARRVGGINSQGFVVGVYGVDKARSKSMGCAHNRTQIGRLGNSLHPDTKITAHV